MAVKGLVLKKSKAAEVSQLSLQRTPAGLIDRMRQILLYLQCFLL